MAKEIQKKYINLEELANDPIRSFIPAINKNDLAGLSLEEDKLHRISKINLFANENISGFFRYLPIKDSAILTICNSGDYIINAFFFGAEKIIAFDSNIFNVFLTDLKLTAIDYFTYKEFKRFFFRQDFLKDKVDCRNLSNPQIFDFSKYLMIKEGLNDISRSFFDRIYEINHNAGFKLLESGLFKENPDSITDNADYDRNIMRCNPYLQSEELYKKMQSKIRGKEVEWHEASSKNCTSILHENMFDVVLLSDLSEHSGREYHEEEKHLDSFSEYTIIPLKHALNKNGIICAEYLHDEYPGNKSRKKKEEERIRQEVFSMTELRYKPVYIEGYNKERMDEVIFLQK